MASSSANPLPSTPKSDEVHVAPVEDDETPVEVFHVRAKYIGRPGDSPTSSTRSKREEYYNEDGQIRHGVAELVDGEQDGAEQAAPPVQPPRTFREKASHLAKSYSAYVKTRDFWIVLILGQVLAVANTGSGTFSQLLSMNGASIPAFQTFFNYVLLNIIYTSYTIYRYGWKAWFKLLFTDGWRYFILAFCDVQGNYFTVLAYEYTTILSAQLINFWAIVVVVIVSFIFLRVRYGWSQCLGILICVGGMGILLASDHIWGTNGGQAQNQLKGDLFALAGATFYGLSNTFEEFLVSKRPLYEVIGQLAFWAMFINGVQCSIFDRQHFQEAQWSPQVGGYLAGYTLVLTIFYSLAPILFRMGSAAFFNISMLTMNFWGAIIGTQVLGSQIHTLYPVAFVLIIIGLMIYFVSESIMGEAAKPWLGAHQEKGVDGIGTARRKVERLAAANGGPHAESATPGIV